MHIDITGLPPERIGFALSPLAELGNALHVLGEPGHHPGLHGWATATAASLKPDLADRLHEADFLWLSTFSDIFLPFAGVRRGGGTGPGVTLAEDLDLLDMLPDAEFVALALEFTCSVTYDKGGPSPLVDTATRARAMDLAAARGPRQVDFTERLLNDPVAVRAWIRRLFEDCEQAFFGDTWRRVRVQLAADARHKSEILRHKGLGDAMAAVSAALSLDGSGTRIRVDKLADGSTTATGSPAGDGLTFVPSSFGWPHLLVLHRPDWRPVIQYPVAAPDLPSPASVELLKLRLEALAHPMRLRLCRSLARSAQTTGELADTYGISAPEVSRHLAVLKRAGLLTTRRRGRYVLHQLDITVVARLGSDFLEGVLR
ncbi:DUF5937 family protein [Streptomyces sp. NPDC051320]|uniref:DUF5937 family protein n=1 Tax=Streptomyces sp. NPDC051320 TaxID=3154644 RepID=UPI003430010B